MKGQVHSEVAQVEYEVGEDRGRVHSEVAQVEYEVGTNRGRVNSIIAQVEYEPAIIHGYLYSGPMAQIEYEVSVDRGRVHSLVLQVEYEPIPVSLLGNELIQGDVQKFRPGRQGSALSHITGQKKSIV